MINPAMFSSASEEWATPQDLFNALDKEFNFTLDVCATEENTKVENRYYDKQADGLKQSWDVGPRESVWCNPPYSRALGKWVSKAFNTALGGSRVVMLLPARTDVRWFHDFIYESPHTRVEIRFLKGRLKFGGSKNSAPFPSMVVIFNP